MLFYLRKCYSSRSKKVEIQNENIARVFPTLNTCDAIHCLKVFWFEQVVLKCLFIATIEVSLFKQLYSLSTSRNLFLNF